MKNCKNILMWYGDLVLLPWYLFGCTQHSMYINNNGNNDPQHVVVMHTNNNNNNNNNSNNNNNYYIHLLLTNAVYRTNINRLNDALNSDPPPIDEAIQCALFESAIMIGRDRDPDSLISIFNQLLGVALTRFGNLNNILDNNHNNLFHYMAQYRGNMNPILRKHVLDTLHAGGLNLIAMNVDGNTPLHETAGNRRSSMKVFNWFKSKLKDHPATLGVLCQNNRYNTPLHLAATLENPSKVKRLLTKRWQGGLASYYRNIYNDTPLHKAVACSNRATVQHLLNHRSSSTTIKARNWRGNMPLHVAIEKNCTNPNSANLQNVETLLNRSDLAILNHSNDNGLTPMQIAQAHHNDEIAHMITARMGAL